MTIALTLTTPYEFLSQLGDSVKLLNNKTHYNPARVVLLTRAISGSFTPTPAANRCTAEKPGPHVKQKVIVHVFVSRVSEMSRDQMRC